MNPIPFTLILIPLLFVYSSAGIYRSLYPKSMVEQSLKIIADYRLLKEEAKKSKRALKKLRSMETDYRKAKRIITRSTLIKLILLMITYMSGSIVFLYTMPLIPSPYAIPLLTVTVEEAYYVPTFILYFLSYILFYMFFRDSFL